MSDPQYTGGSAIYTGRDRVKSLAANPDAISTVEDMRLSEMQGIHRRLGRICAARQEGTTLRRVWRRVEWDRTFGTLAAMFFSGAIGGAIGLVPILGVQTEASERALSDRALVEYVIALGVCAFVGLLALLARMAIKVEREASVMDIYTDLGEIIGRYDATSMQERDESTA